MEKTKTKTIRQSANFKATPHDVYEALLDSKKHSRFTGGEASISRKVGGRFTAYDGYITGKNLELIKDKKIVQSWRASDWPAGADSVATFILSTGKNETKLSFTQTNIPAEQAESIANGWKEYYWEPMKEMLEK